MRRLFTFAKFHRWLRTYGAQPLLVLLLFVGFALRTLYLSVDRFHADEALYAGWALLIGDGDPWLLSVPVDKPPLFLYILALCGQILGTSEAMLRLPNIAASTLSIALTFQLGRQLYDQSTGIWAAAFVAFSPFDLLFARTAFTDPTLVLWTLTALVMASRNLWLASGVSAGLAYATKQHAVLLLVLILGIGILGNKDSRSSTLRTLPNKLAVGAIGFALPYAGVILWDSTRWPIRPGFWTQSALSYGGLAWSLPSAWAERLYEWLFWSKYMFASPLLTGAVAVGIPLLLLYGWHHRPISRSVWTDTVLAGYAGSYLAIHVLFEFSIWDRYLLPLIAPLAILLSRVVSTVQTYLADWSRPSLFLRTLWTGAVLLSAFSPAWQGARNEYPVGGEHWAYQGLEQVVDYLHVHAPPGAVLYHHWLRWHYEYYLYGADLELRWWESGEHLHREAVRTEGRMQYLVLPDWAPLYPDAAGIELILVFEAHRQDGSVSMRVFQLQVPTNDKEVQALDDRILASYNPLAHCTLVDANRPGAIDHFPPEPVIRT